VPCKRRAHLKKSRNSRLRTEDDEGGWLGDRRTFHENSYRSGRVIDGGDAWTRVDYSEAQTLSQRAPHINERLLEGAHLIPMRISGSPRSHSEIRNIGPRGQKTEELGGRKATQKGTHLNSEIGSLSSSDLSAKEPVPHPLRVSARSLIASNVSLSFSR